MKAPFEKKWNITYIFFAFIGLEVFCFFNELPPLSLCVLMGLTQKTHGYQYPRIGIG